MTPWWASLGQAARVCGHSGRRSPISPKGRPRLFDDLVGAQQDRWGYGKAERLGGLAVHDHLKFRRQLHREIARLRFRKNWS